MSDGFLSVDDAGNYAFGTLDLEPWFADYKALHLSATVALSWSKLSNELNLVNNAYQVSSTEWRYRSTGSATRIRMEDTAITFMHAAGGTIDTAVTWVTDFAIAPSGAISIGSLVGGTAKLNLQPNTASDLVVVGGLVYVTTTQTGNATTVDTLLAGASIVANLLAVNGQSLRFEAWGTTANNANVKTLRVRLGTTGDNTVLARTLTPSAANNWLVQGTIYRTGAATQKSVAHIVDGAVSEIDISTTLNQTLSAGPSLNVWGQGVANNDIVLQGYKVWWDDYTN